MVANSSPTRNTPATMTAAIGTMATLERGVGDGGTAATGWLGRHLQSSAGSHPSPVRAIAVGDTMPASLEEALTCLEEDHAFMMKGDVFTEELIETFIEYKRKNECDAVRLRPHPYEFALYYDV